MAEPKDFEKFFGAPKAPAPPKPAAPVAPPKPTQQFAPQTEPQKRQAEAVAGGSRVGVATAEARAQQAITKSALRSEILKRYPNLSNEEVNRLVDEEAAKFVQPLAASSFAGAIDPYKTVTPTTQPMNIPTVQPAGFVDVFKPQTRAPSQEKVIYSKANPYKSTASFQNIKSQGLPADKEQDALASLNAKASVFDKIQRENPGLNIVQISDMVEREVADIPKVLSGAGPKTVVRQPMAGNLEEQTPLEAAFDIQQTGAEVPKLNPNQLEYFSSIKNSQLPTLLERERKRLQAELVPEIRIQKVQTPGGEQDLEVPTGKKRNLTEAEIEDRLKKFKDEAIPWYADKETLEEYKTKGAPPSVIGILSTELATGNVVEAPAGYALRVLTSPLNAIAGAVGYAQQSLYDLATGADIQSKKEAGRPEKFVGPGVKANMIANIAEGGGYTKELGEFGYYNPNKTIQSFYPAFYGAGFLVDLSGLGDMGIIKGAAGGARGAAAGARAASTAAVGAPLGVKVAEAAKGAARFGTDVAASEFIRELPIIGEKLAKEISPQDVRVVYGQKMADEFEDAASYKDLYENMSKDIPLDERNQILKNLLKNKNSNFANFARSNDPSLVIQKLDPNSKTFFFKGFEEEFDEVKKVTSIEFDLRANADLDTGRWIPKSFPTLEKSEYISMIRPIRSGEKSALMYPTFVPTSSQEALLKPYVTFLAKRDPEFEKLKSLKSFPYNISDEQIAAYKQKVDEFKKQTNYDEIEKKTIQSKSKDSLVSDAIEEWRVKFFSKYPNLGVEDFNKANRTKRLRQLQKESFAEYMRNLNELNSIEAAIPKFQIPTDLIAKDFNENEIRSVQKLIGSKPSIRVRPSDIYTAKVKQDPAYSYEISKLASFAAGVKAVDKSLSKALGGIGLTGTRLIAVTPKTFAAPRQADEIMNVFKKGDLYSNLNSKLKSSDAIQFKGFYGDIVTGITLNENQLDSVTSSLGSGYASGLITRKDFDRIQAILKETNNISYDDLRLLSYAEVDTIAKQMKQGITTEMFAGAPVSAKIDQPIIAKNIAQQRRAEEIKSNLPIIANRTLNRIKDKFQPIKAQITPQQSRIIDEAMGRVSALNIKLRDEYTRALKDPNYAAMFGINPEDPPDLRIIKLSIGQSPTQTNVQQYIKELISSMIFSTDNTSIYNAFFSGYHFGDTALDQLDGFNALVNKYSDISPDMIWQALDNLYDDVKKLVETDVNPIRKARGGKVFTVPEDMKSDALIAAYFRNNVLNITADALTKSISERLFTINDAWTQQVVMQIKLAQLELSNRFTGFIAPITRNDIVNSYYTLVKQEIKSPGSIIDKVYEINGKISKQKLNDENISANIPQLNQEELEKVNAIKQKIEEIELRANPEETKFEAFSSFLDEIPSQTETEQKLEQLRKGTLASFADDEAVLSEQSKLEIEQLKNQIELINQEAISRMKVENLNLKRETPKIMQEFLSPILRETFKTFSEYQINALSYGLGQSFIAYPNLAEDITFTIESLVDTGIINRLPNSSQYSLDEALKTMDLLAREKVSPNSFTSPAMIMEIKKQLGGEPKFNQLMTELARLSDAAAGGDGIAISVSNGVRKALQMWNSFYYNMMLSINPRFQIPNILTAPFIISYTTGKNVIGRESLNNATTAMRAMAMGSPMATEAGRNTLAVVDKLGVPYTYGNLYDLCVKNGVFRSQASTEIPANFLEDAKSILDSGLIKKDPFESAKRLEAGKTLISPVQTFIGDPMATYTDNVWRAFVVIDAIKGGSTIDEALILGRKSLFDYGDVTSVERDFARRFFVFYNYFRQGVGQFVKNLFEDPSRTIKLMRMTKGISQGSTAYFGGESEDISFYYPPEWGVSRAVFSVTPAKNYKEGKAILAPNMPYSDGLNVIGGVLVDPVGAIIGPEKAAGMGRAFDEGIIARQLGPVWEMAGNMLFTPNALNNVKVTKNRIPPEHMALYYVAGLDKLVTSTFNVRVEKAQQGENALEGNVFVMDSADFERYKVLVAATQTTGVSRPMSDWGKVFGGAGVMIGRNPRLTGSYPENLAEFVGNTTGAITVTGAGRPTDVQEKVLEAQILQMQKKQKEIEEKQVIKKPKIER